MTKEQADKIIQQAPAKWVIWALARIKQQGERHA